MPKFHVSRSIEIQASPDEVFDNVSDFSTWTTWSPWLLAEPTANVTVSKDSSSVGSTYAWQGDVVGVGEMEHQSLTPGQKIESEIRFLKPFKSISKVVFEFAATSGGTQLTWHMYGSLPFFLFFMKPHMETFIGMDYERGLRMLKEWIETGAISSSVDVKGVQPVDGMTVVGVRKTSPLSEIGPAMNEAYSEADQRMAAAGVPTDGQMVSVYHRFDTKSGIFEFTSGYQVPEGKAPATTNSKGLSVWSLPATTAFRVDHRGKYDHLGNAWSAANQIARYKKMKQSKVGTFEIYKNKPETTPPEELETEIYLPLK